MFKDMFANRWVRILLGLAVIAVIVGGGVLAYIWFSGGSGEASEPISAPSIQDSQAAAADNGSSDDSTTDSAADDSAVAEADTSADTAAEDNSAAAEAAAASEPVLFQITSDESQVSFTLTEDLGGVHTTVVGTTDQVAGEILVDFAAPTNSQVGTVRINVRTLATDNEFRNRAIRGQILQSSQDQYEFAEFVPTALAGLPESVAVGDTFSFQIIGDLTVRDTTSSVTFDATVTVVAESRLEGSATTTVARSTYGLNIPNVPNVANVSEDVALGINFVALAA